MKICGLEKLSLVDFDNYVACTLFVEGCNFRCPFCHNAPLVIFDQNVEIDQDEIFAFLEKRKKTIDGVCISGGEPTLYPDLPDFIKKVKAFGYKIKLDTNGTNPKMLESLINGGLIDYVAMDVKSSIDGYYDASLCTEKQLENVLKSVEILKENKIAYEFRTTLVKNLHSFDEILGIAKIVEGCPKYFLQKYIYNENCIGGKFEEVDNQTAITYCKALRDMGINAILRGYDILP